jgi:hypothetical protein
VAWHSARYHRGAARYSCAESVAESSFIQASQIPADVWDAGPALTMNVYTKMTYWSTFVALVLFTAFLTGEMWVMTEFPKLNPIAVHIVTVALFIATIRRIARQRTKPGRNYLIDPVTGKPRKPAT